MEDTTVDGGRGSGSARSSAVPAVGSTALLENVVFGAAAGVTGTTIVFPFYTMKTFLMSGGGRVAPAAAATNGSGTGMRRLSSLMYVTANGRFVVAPWASVALPTRWMEAAAPSASAPASPSVLQAFRSIVRTEGVRGLYRGLSPTLIGVAPEKAIKLSANDYFTAKLREYNRQPGAPLSLWQGMLAGAGAGLCQVVATNPMELLMITMQTRATRGEPHQSVVSTMRQLGVRGMYRGLTATMARDIPFSTIFFGLNTSLKQWWAERCGTAHIPVGSVFVIGVFAGALAAAVSTPMDVAKTRIQGRIRDASGKPYTHVVDTLRRIVLHEGAPSLFAGMVPRMLIVGPLFGITLLFYEVQQRVSHRTRRRQREQEEDEEEEEASTVKRAYSGS
ncbi:hypothetical protein CDCA_CDCA10G3006 [Cyanidium caldarium]|uniref:Mitochondrial carrier protein n=1 Tax=Cyanidium caldarium TaxID=2771 RepID=A0AAV9IY17_CYACA|nr:hypothetical protein CDCA_CDCA10G3006 [Cyanidium caldarium]